MVKWTDKSPTDVFKSWVYIVKQSLTLFMHFPYELNFSSANIYWVVTLTD